MIKNNIFYSFLCIWLNTCNITYGSDTPCNNIYILGKDAIITNLTQKIPSGYFEFSANLKNISIKIERKEESPEHGDINYTQEIQLSKSDIINFQHAWFHMPRNGDNVELIINTDLRLNRTNDFFKLIVTPNDYEKFVDATTTIVSFQQSPATKQKNNPDCPEEDSQFRNLFNPLPEKKITPDTNYLYNGLKRGAWGLGIFTILYCAMHIKHAEQFIIKWLQHS